MDTSQVVNPIEHLRGEIKGIGDTLAEIDGNIATMYVQRARMIVLHDALVAGFRALHGESPVDGQLELKLVGGEL